MASEFVMPKLGLTMESGTIVEWLVEDDEEVADGVSVAVIETDKVETEVMATEAGRLRQHGKIGESYDCGEPIGWFLAEGEEAPSPRAAVSAPATAEAVTPAVVKRPAGSGGDGKRRFVSPNARRVAQRLGVDVDRVMGTGPNGRVVSEDVELAAREGTAHARAGAGGPVSASVAARQLASLVGVDLGQVSATARITRADVAAHVRARFGAPIPVEKPPAPPLAQEPTATVPLTGMRGVIAARMHESLLSSAQLTLTMDVAMDVVVADRTSRRGDDVVPGYTDYVIDAVAVALVEHPIVNSQVTDDEVALLREVHVGMAVAVDDGLLVPVVRDANERSLVEIAEETTRLASAARDKRLSPADLEGGTFSVSALGMFGVDMFTPVINPPNTAILGVGRIRDDVVWHDDGSPGRSKTMTISLTWDHRAFDGAPAAQFAASIRSHLEEG